MNDIYVTLTGNVAAPPRQHTFPDGSRVTSLKIASTSRYFDRENQQWRNGETTYFGVRCFRGLADNVAQSVHLGQPVVVQGRLRIREFAHEGERRFMPEVEANSLGHDLRWGLGSFTKPQRGGPVAALGSAERIELDRETSDWAMSGGAPVAAGAVGALPLLKTGSDDSKAGLDDETSTPRETEITPGGEAAGGDAMPGDITHPEGIAHSGDILEPRDAIDLRDAVYLQEGVDSGEAAGVPPRGADHEAAGKEPAEGETTARRGRAGKSTPTRRQDAAGRRSSGAGEEMAGGVPGAMRTRPDASDETPWPMRESVAA
ncbi:single-stranded DNA-binding protein [Streptosporangium sp. NPDC023963]|uniref:single-stranded DNA-binding protein n=1 Tax=Streptosporangium sp. NPDC023963 TaxID=3155608 RepID=UPI00344A697D